MNISKLKEYWSKVTILGEKYWKWIVGVLLILLLFSWCSGCATAKSMELDKNYLAYLEAVRTPPKILELEGIPGQSIELKGISKFIVYGVVSTQIEQLRVPMSTGAIMAKEFFGFLKGAAPYAIGWKALDVMQSGINNAGHNMNISDSYKDSHNIADSYNTPTTSTTTNTTTNTATLNDSFNGDNRDVGGNNDAHSDRHDINDSNNDRHDVTGTPVNP